MSIEGDKAKTMTAANDNIVGLTVHGTGTAKPCPICGRPADELSRPFCSKRCADIDLHRWLGGRYAVPADPGDDTTSE